MDSLYQFSTLAVSRSWLGRSAQGVGKWTRIPRLRASSCQPPESRDQTRHVSPHTYDIALGADLRYNYNLTVTILLDRISYRYEVLALAITSI